MGNISIYGELKRVSISSNTASIISVKPNDTCGIVFSIDTTLERRTLGPKSKKPTRFSSTTSKTKQHGGELIYRPAARGEATDGSARAHLCLFTTFLAKEPRRDSANPSTKRAASLTGVLMRHVPLVARFFTIPLYLFL